MLLTMRNKRNSHSFWWEHQNGATTLEDSWAVSYKTKHILTIWSSNRAPWYSPKRAKTLCTQNPAYKPVFVTALPISAKSWKSPRCPSGGEWIDKLWSIETMGYDSAIKRNGYQAMKRHGTNLKSIIISERSQFEKASCCKVPTIWPSRKGRTMQMV